MEVQIGEPSQEDVEGIRIGGILTQPLSLSYHLFSNMHESRINTGDFYDLACFHCLSYFSCLGPISSLNRHQRHQTALSIFQTQFAVSTSTSDESSKVRPTFRVILQHRL